MKKLLTVDEYLDLYLLAGKLGDPSWQNEIMDKLKKGEYIAEQTLKIRNLWNKYKKVNMEMLDLYRQLQKDASNEAVTEKIRALKLQRSTINKQIQQEQKKSQHSHSKSTK
ncbi:hypothetical protein [Bacillus tuaregi]|uniref:hypothetical protein n=1 Tax=Bacillus tuaregi TaxID=1816695 RepID=UPI0008F913EF|nr:hypothetical protein [Bacillus tuaregi]